MPTRHPVFGAGPFFVGYFGGPSDGDSIESDDDLRFRMTRQREGMPLHLTESDDAYRARLMGFRDQYGTQRREPSPVSFAGAYTNARTFPNELAYAYYGVNLDGMLKSLAELRKMLDFQPVTSGGVGATPNPTSWEAILTDDF